MKKEKFLIAFILSLFISSSVFAACSTDGTYNEETGEFTKGEVQLTYGEDGSVTVQYTSWGEEIVQTYDSVEDMLFDFYGFRPEMTLSQDIQNIMSGGNQQNASNNSNSSHKIRGRLIYTVQEADAVAKEGSVNKVRLRYK
ncbi:MAG: hypothetical protein IKS23_01040 [Alphaproteobacteria bacterium]|nr:hypothetical protein [Alphaproteobacteria bacterium]